VLSADANSRTREREGKTLRVIGIHPEVGEKKRFTARLIAAATWLYGHENSIDLCQGLGILGLQNPALLGRVVFVKYAEVDRLLKVWSPTTPRLKCRGVIFTLLLIEVVGVKDQRLLFC